MFIHREAVGVEGHPLSAQFVEAFPAPDHEVALHFLNGVPLDLIPGLFDAHVHISASPETFGPMLLANGVTCVRDTGAPTEMIVAMREQASGPDSMLPQIICTGAIIDGDPPVWPFSQPCDEPEEARAAVRKLAEAGVDQIKVYSLLDKAVYEAAVSEAHTLGLKVTGHVPLKVTLEEAMAEGHEQATLAMEVFSYRIARYIASLSVGLKQLDALIFTGGIGENSDYVRAKVLGHLAIFRFDLDTEQNLAMRFGAEGAITKRGVDAGAAPQCWVIPTNEEWVIAEQSAALIKA